MLTVAVAVAVRMAIGTRVTVAVFVRRLIRTSISRSLEFFINALAGQGIQITHTITKLTGIVQHSVIEFDFQIDTGSTGPIVGFTDFTAQPNVQLY